MTAHSREWDSRKVESPQRKRSAKAQRARDAKRLMERIEARTSERHEIWAGIEPLPNLAQRVGSDLTHLHGEKRAMRRDIYADAPQLEGRPVFKGIPGGRS